MKTENFLQVKGKEIRNDLKGKSYTDYEIMFYDVSDIVRKHLKSFVCFTSLESKAIFINQTTEKVISQYSY